MVLLALPAGSLKNIASFWSCVLNIQMNLSFRPTLSMTSGICTYLIHKSIWKTATNILVTCCITSPISEMRSEEDARNLRRAWEKTLAFYKSTFGETVPSDLWPKSNRCPNCGRRCRRGDKGLNNQTAVFDERRPRLADIGLSL